MPVESAVYISDLNSSFPPDADPVGQADDHLRLIKNVLKTTFPNLTGPVTANQAQLNSPFPTGAICYWYGTTTSVPSGWALCDGRTVAKSDGSGNITTPNLTDTFIRCAAGGTVAAAATGGAASHSHNLTIAGHGLTTSEMAAHTHAVTDPGHGHTVNDPGHQHGMQTFPQYSGVLTGSVNVNLYALSPTAGSTSPLITTNVATGISINGNTTGISIQSAGSGAAHGHPGSTSDSQSNVPPYVGLVPIMKV